MLFELVSCIRFMEPDALSFTSTLKKQLYITVVKS